MKKKKRKKKKKNVEETYALREWKFEEAEEAILEAESEERPRNLPLAGVTRTV